MAKKPESLPQMARNIYVQTLRQTLGQYGANEAAEPPVLPFDDRAEAEIVGCFGDAGARVFGVPE